MNLWIKKRIFYLEKKIEGKVELFVLKSGEEIVGLGIELKSSTASAEFDIVTEDTLIECKNINSEKISDKALTRFQNQAGRAYAVANELNKGYKIYFKGVPSDKIIKWLKNRHINYEIL